MSPVCGTFQASYSVPLLSHRKVRSASVLVSHPELHSHSRLINQMTGDK